MPFYRPLEGKRVITGSYTYRHLKLSALKSTVLLCCKTVTISLHLIWIC